MRASSDERLMALMEALRKTRRNSGLGAREVRYRLNDFGGGTFARELKDDEVTEDEPKHLACPHCLEMKRKSILQCQGKNMLAQDM